MMISERLAREYRALKAGLPADVLLLMQVGAFMQVLDDDARAVATVTGLRLQMGGPVDAPVVAGGLPVAGLDASVGKLARAGRQRPVRRVPVHIRAIRYREQVARFRVALPRHELLVQRGWHWDWIPPRWLTPLPAKAPRAWIVETGARLGPLRERRVAWTERQDHEFPSPLRRWGRG